MIRFTDCDTGETTLDVVQIPEGVSLQMQPITASGEPDGDYVSIILNRGDVVDLVRELQRALGGMEGP